MHDLYDSVIATYKGKPGALLSVLEEVQRKTDHTYLNEQALLYIAQQMEVPLSQVYSVVSFFSFFNLKPQGEHTITVCRGTACHTRGSKPLLDDVMAMLDLHEGGEESYFTTSDMRFTVRTVACFGQCALAPVIAVDEVIYSRMTSDKLASLLKQLMAKREKA
ncbi:NAD(P)H-dependent oxidoreductase subunit E [Sphaerochaeta sp. PS]|uniref:NADH-quinone oxidoreductase subunit NuoE family protein n=1 Tax=Sphaerochaeta sp. PS TaxID=3076336 RepID=UPI0028A4274E|nr:NAD(P)H-dependent oxidoreductase subunit E [Sphaerochaeta sp. PS]MDT4761696.1 NAD(P)H-dependent oxidoreductase subunit E [Sphaerochaeta sp. PS]